MMIIFPDSRSFVIFPFQVPQIMRLFHLSGGCPSDVTLPPNIWVNSQFPEVTNACIVYSCFDLHTPEGPVTHNQSCEPSSKTVLST